MGTGKICPHFPRCKADGEHVFCKDAGLQNARFGKQVVVGAPEGGLPVPDHVKYAHGGHFTMAGRARQWDYRAAARFLKGRSRCHFL